MRQDVSDVELLPIVMNGCDEPEFVSPDVEDRKLTDLISRRKALPQVNEGRVVGLTHNREPVLQRHARVRRACAKSSSRFRVILFLVLAILIPRIALLDGPEHGFLQLPECHVVWVANGLEFLV